MAPRTKPPQARTNQPQSEPDAARHVISICVYCGSAFGNDSGFRELAHQLGTLIGQRGMRLVYGGGAVGLMGVTARAAKDNTPENGPKILGVIPRFLADREVAFDDIDPVLVDNMHERKAIMYHESDAFVVLPGGIGTLEEAIEVLSWARLELHQKPVIFIDHLGFWKPMIDLLHHVIEAGFAPPHLENLWTEKPDARSALDWIEAHLAAQ